MKKIIIFAALCLSFLTACDKEDLGVEYTCTGVRL